MSEVIMKVSSLPVPLAVKSRNESRPAIGTPMKLTRSLPAKAIARANVPIITTSLNTSTFSRWIISINIVEMTKVMPMSMGVLVLIHDFVVSSINGDFDRPFINIK